MKYIRTKDGIYEVRKEYDIYYEVFVSEAQREYEYDGVLYDWDDFLKKDVIKESDNIKELVDGYYLDIDNHSFDSTQVYDKNELERALEENADWQSYSDRKCLEYEINLYAFIKTDKGLIYVAKLDEKGDLQLL